MLPPPPPARRDDVADVLHGVTVPDPYRWLEDGEDPATTAWVQAQNTRTQQALDARPERAGWHERLVALLALPVSMGCQVAGDQVFTLERWGGRPQFALVVRDAQRSATPPRVLLDPAQIATDGTAAIDWYHPSPDGDLVAYGVSEGGNERSVLRVLDVRTGQHLPDEIPDTRAASVGWIDAETFLYTRYPAGDEYNRKVYQHRLGRPWADDELVWGDLPTPQSWPDVSVSRDGRRVLVHVAVGWGRTDVHLLDREAGTWRTLIEGVDALTRFTFAELRLVGTTTVDAPKGRVVATSFHDVTAWSTLVPEGDDVIDEACAIGGGLLVRSTASGVARLRHFDGDGTPLGEVALPGLSSFAGFDAHWHHQFAFCQLEGFTSPATLYRWVPGEGLHPWTQQDPAVDPTRFVVTHERYGSTDGTPIGMFLVHRADVAPGTSTPCILTGYGGFAISETPAWSPLAAAWCEAGGLFAVAGLRGGLEEGEAWHRAGRREHKQNVFDDFRAAAAALLVSGRTSPERLAFRGGSNGGLLVGAALTQWPDLARAVHCAVPLLDMVRFPQFLIARLWTDEYGDPDVAEEFGWLWAYSPYHRVQHGTCYPAVLLTTAEGDSRVDPLHARKMAAALQWASTCEERRPILLRQEDRAGHGQGKPLHKQADEGADVLAFFSWQLGAPAPLAATAP